MASVFLLAIGVAVSVALIFSVTLHFSTAINDSGLTPQEQNCQQIANEGYRIHTIYPDSNPDELLDYDHKRLMHLDELWITECVNVLSAESIFNIVNNVERDFSFGE